MFYKICITTRFTSRLSHIKKHYPNWNVIMHKKFDGLTALKIENELQYVNEKYRYIPKIRFGGYLECFSDINKNECYEILSSR